MKNIKTLILMAGVLASTLPATAQIFVSHTVNQAPQLVADAGGLINFCAGDSVQLGGSPSAIGGTPSIAYSWTPSAGLSSPTAANPALQPVANGDFVLSLIDGNGCSASDTTTLNLATPTASFSSSSALLVAAFSDQSTFATTWSWDFGDGGTSTAQNPSHTYAAQGTYNVCLTINGGSNCEATACDSVSVLAIGIANVLPGFDISVYPNPASGNQVNFDVKGAALSGAITIELMDLQGRIVSVYEGASGLGVHTVSRKQLAAGAYQYRVRNAEGIMGSGKLIFR